MTPRADMIELAQRRAGLNRQAAQEQLQREIALEAGLHLSTKEIARQNGVSVDTVRYRMHAAGFKPVKVGTGAGTSYAHGYALEAVQQVFTAATAEEVSH